MIFHIDLKRKYCGADIKNVALFFAGSKSKFTKKETVPEKYAIIQKKEGRFLPYKGEICCIWQSVMTTVK